MTTIIYHRGLLATDSKIGRHLGTQAERYIHGEKVFASACGRCYITKAGTMFTPETNQKYADELMALVMEFEDKGVLSILDLLDKPILKYEWLVITRDTTLFFEDQRCCHLTGNDWVGMGSGGVYAKAAIAAGKNPHDAVELTYKFDPMSGGHIHCYAASALKSLRGEAE